MKIELTLEQLNKFLKKLNPKTIVRDEALKEIGKVLQHSLDTNVFTSHDDTLFIPTKDELRRLIRTGGTPQKGAPYNQEYLKKKRRRGEYLPHMYENYNFRYGTKIQAGRGSVIMSVTPTGKNITGNFKDGSKNYVEYHERHRSVLKTAFFRAWQDIIDKTIETYANEAQK